MDLSYIAWLWTAALVLILSVGIYRYLTSIYSYWEKRGVFHEPAKSLFMMFYNIITKDMGEMELERYKKYGRLYGRFEGRTPVLCVADPELIRDILVKDFPAFPSRPTISSGDPVIDKMVSVIDGDDTWKRIRSIISPTFSTGKIKRESIGIGGVLFVQEEDVIHITDPGVILAIFRKYTVLDVSEDDFRYVTRDRRTHWYALCLLMTNIVLSSAKTLGRNFAATEGKPVDIKKLCETFTMDVIASVAFATKIHSYHDPNNIFLQQAKKIFPSGVSWRLALFLLLPPKMLKLLRLSPFDVSATTFFKEETLKIMEDRKKSGTTRNDFLQMLMEVEEETRGIQNKKGKTEEISKNVDDLNAEELGHDEANAKLFEIQKSMKFLTQDELIAQCVLFFIAGFAGTSVVITFAMYLLSVNPEAQERLREEIDEVTLKNDKKMTYAGIQEMAYLDRVVTETLRMYSPAIRVDRIAGEDYKLGDTGIVIEKGKMISIPVNGIHSDPEFYPEPEKFDPDRFTTEGKASRHPYSYIAFGAGPRNCVAMRFALMEVKLCVAFIVSQFLIKLSPETKEPLVIRSGFGGLDPIGLRLNFEKRENRVFDGLQADDETGE